MLDFSVERRYFNREMSLLDFQERVLALAENPDRPLLERVKFAAIVSSNLDEFFQVRVAGLQEQVKSGVDARSIDGNTAAQQLVEIAPRIRELEQRIDALLTKELIPRLRDEGIEIVPIDELPHDERRAVYGRFESEVFPVLTPLAVDTSHPFPYISDLSLNLAVLVRDPTNVGLQFARVKIPPNVPRFMAIGDDGPRFVLLEDLVGHHLDRLFGGLEVVDSYVFRVTRSADIAVEEEEADDLLEAMESVLRFRQRSARAARLEVEAGVAENVLQLLLQGLQLDQDSVYLREAPLGLSGLWELYGAVGRPDLKDEPWTPPTQPRLAERPGRPAVDFFAEIRRGDILVHHPYGSFATSTGAFLAQAASDTDVLAIKQTLYRTSIPDDPAIGGEAAIVRHLMDAGEAGKQVVVLVELKARFDEAANINWAKMLEAAGVHVVYGVHGLKTHSKTLLVVRKEGDTIRRYSHIGTGNYNPKTARIYEDLGLFTADDDIGADLSELFNHLTGYAMPTSYRKLLVAPHTLRPRLIERIREQGSLGSRGRILLKLNHLMDKEIIDELYAASQRGARIDIIVRGVCGLRAGVPGLSENISVRSIVGTFLEHSRIYRFGDPANGAVYYIGSADLMPRNLDGRVEALVPITDPRIKSRLEQIIEVLMADDALAWEMGRDGKWTKVPNERHLDSHRTLQRLALERARGEDQASLS